MYPKILMIAFLVLLICITPTHSEDAPMIKDSATISMSAFSNDLKKSIEKKARDEKQFRDASIEILKKHLQKGTVEIFGSKLGMGLVDENIVTEPKSGEAEVDGIKWRWELKGHLGEVEIDRGLTTVSKFEVTIYLTIRKGDFKSPTNRIMQFSSTPDVRFYITGGAGPKQNATIDPKR